MEIREALEFLLTNGYLERKADGGVHTPEKRIDCLGGVYRIALTQFHREMFELAGRSIEAVPGDRRSILGHGIAVDRENFDRARQILDEAFERIRALQPEPSRTEDVYFMHLALFPLTQGVKS